MRCYILLLLVVGLLMAADAKKDDAKQDLAKFQGNWSLISAERDGKKTPDDEARKISLSIQANKYLLRRESQVISEGTFTLDPTKTPKQIDETATAGPNKGKVFLAVYEINDQQHKICFAAPGKERPTAFSAEAGSGQLLQVWKREAQDQAIRTFTYKKTKEADLAIHVHLPDGWKKEDKRPAIVFFFGGGWTQGNVKQFEPQATYLASRGMVAARADYRVKSRHKVTPDQCVEDAKSALRWVRKNAVKLGVDPDRIVASGGSAGGHLAACTGCCPGPEGEGEDLKISSTANALVLFNPALRFHGLPGMMKFLGKDDEALAKLMTPTLHLKKESPPALLLFGKEDRLLVQGEEFVKRSKEVGSRAEMYLAEGVGHGFFNRSPWRENTLQRVDEFLESLGYLKGKPTILVP